MDDQLFKEPTGDPTLEAALEAKRQRDAKRFRSARVGGSSGGKECLRESWYSFRWLTAPEMIDPKGLLTVEDGFAAEEKVAGILRLVPGLELYTTEWEDPKKQITFYHTRGHFVGKLDGVVLGLLQAPKTWHVWENKSCNEKKVAALIKAKDKYGEKNALEQWNPVYWAQAQLYMDGMGMDRHYCTVCLPGVRDIISIRTDRIPKQVDILKAKIERIVFNDVIPPRISQDPAFFACKFCSHHATCHGSKLPDINCRTCRFSQPVDDGKWMCNKWSIDIDYKAQEAACTEHRFRPELIPGVELVQGENDFGRKTAAYELRDKSGFRDDDKEGRPKAPYGEAPKVATGDWFCTGCGELYTNGGLGEQCASCSAYLEPVK